MPNVLLSLRNIDAVYTVEFVIVLKHWIRMRINHAIKVIIPCRSKLTRPKSTCKSFNNYYLECFLKLYKDINVRVWVRYFSMYPMCKGISYKGWGWKALQTNALWRGNTCCWIALLDNYALLHNWSSPNYFLPLV